MAGRAIMGCPSTATFTSGECFPLTRSLRTLCSPVRTALPLCSSVGCLGYTKARYGNGNSTTTWTSTHSGSTGAPPNLEGFCFIDSCNRPSKSILYRIAISWRYHTATGPQRVNSNLSEVDTPFSRFSAGQADHNLGISPLPPESSTKRQKVHSAFLTRVGCTKYSRITRAVTTTRRPSLVKKYL